MARRKRKSASPEQEPRSAESPDEENASQVSSPRNTRSRRAAAIPDQAASTATKRIRKSPSPPAEASDSSPRKRRGRSSSRVSSRDETTSISDAISWQRIRLTSKKGGATMTTPGYFGFRDQLHHPDLEGARNSCPLLALLVANYIAANDKLPNRRALDDLLTEGGMRWAKLLNTEEIAMEHEAGNNQELETVIKYVTDLIIEVQEEGSKTGYIFRAPEDDVEKESKEDKEMSFDVLWKHIALYTEAFKICIVGWSDHFFVITVDNENHFYIIDTLGSQLSSERRKPYVLKFDSTTTFEYEAKPDRFGTTSTALEYEDQPAKSDLNSSEACKLFLQDILAPDTVDHAYQKFLTAKAKLSIARQIDFKVMQRCDDNIWPTR